MASKPIAFARAISSTDSAVKGEVHTHAFTPTPIIALRPPAARAQRTASGRLLREHLRDHDAAPLAGVRALDLRRGADDALDALARLRGDAAEVEQDAARALVAHRLGLEHERLARGRVVDREADAVAEREIRMRLDAHATGREVDAEQRVADARERGLEGEHLRAVGHARA